jgi:predicted TIM-barrel fold metal-dependent hydrolase
MTTKRTKYRVWDLHCHFGGMEGATPDAKMARLIGYADRMGIERVIVFMSYPLLNDPSPDELRRQNDQVLQAISHWHDRAFAFAYVSPRHVDASLQEIDRCVRDGPMVGIKLWVAMRCNTPGIDPIIRRAAELQALIYQHTWLKSGGNPPGESTPMNLVELSARHPDVPLICGHTGGNWERGIRVVRGHKNIAIDLAGSDPTAGFVEMAVRELGPERVLYGSDASGRSFASQLAKVMGAEISEAARSLILGENLRRMLGPIQRAKGMKS